eukprot:CAMPEP_0169110898 /NCGR_PEP_ID=MMETSP1015-20121227/26767_1 /TAXON_ID=342587 /ORGANISM="Karlodinium micrum, Strain CCMP2283" /LENGTH=710 /DNA_ID=CAMNT_0009172739 /DNA_START=126 /DNA_END=2257 /DNA_ORIENTATION=+
MTSPRQQDLTAISLEYTYEDLWRATQGFARDAQLGSGAAGTVYRGVLRGGTEVAVKVIRDAGGIGGFEDEVRVLSRFRHPNLVTLLGWGHKDREKYLVYELCNGGDVGNKLEKCKKGRAQFSWSERLRVACDAARGLAHMVKSEPKAFHRDIKPANILLDAGGAKMADFGLSSVTGEMRNHLTVEQISGTPGYACPMYIQTGRVSEQSEVYSFGMVLLELLLNQPPALAGPQGDIIYPLLATVQPNVPGAHKRVIENLDKTADWPPEVAADFADHAISCAHVIPARRPTFDTVVKVLRSLGRKAGGTSELGAQLGSNVESLSSNPSSLSYSGNGSANPRVAYSSTLHPSSTIGSPDPRVACSSTVHPSSTKGYTQGGTEKFAPSATTGATPIAPQEQQLAEVVLEVVCAAGVNVASLSPAVGAIAFAVDSSKGRNSFLVGRQYQPDFFEKMVLRQEQLHTISRSHLELCWEPSADAPTVRKLSGNPLFFDDRPMSKEVAKAAEGSVLSFAATEDGQCFLVLRVRLRSQAVVTREGRHPAILAALQRRSVRSSGSGGHESVSTLRPGDVTAVLECVYSAGGDVAKLPPDAAAAIPIKLDAQVDVGRQHQSASFFETLLQGQTRWLTFISRSHCRLHLQRVPEAGSAGSPSGYCLRLENLSTNAIVAKGKPLAKGRSEILAEHDKIAFVANPGGPEGEITFLEFVLRRARST